MRALLSVVVVLSAATASFAADRKVGPNAPYETIQAAVDAASPGDRILIAPGTYRERVVVPEETRGLQFLGRGVIWDGTEGTEWGDCLTIPAGHAVVKGIAFRNGSRQVLAMGGDVVVQKCSFRNSADVAVSITGDGARVESCRFAGVAAGVSIDGSDAVVRRNDIRNFATAAILISGDEALVERNTVRTGRYEWSVRVSGGRARLLANSIRNVESGAIVFGEDARVAGNRASQVRWGAFHVEGDHAAVESNRVQGAGEGGIRVIGPRFTVVRNTVSGVAGESAGLFADATFETGGGTVEGNRVSDTTYYGVAVFGSSVDVRRNAATRCGTAAGGGFYLGGTSHEVVSNVSADCDDTAFEVSGILIALRENLARDAGGDGFQVLGYDIRLERNVALRCGGEGLHNHGYDTDVTGCRFSRNRIDVACAHGYGASFDEFSGNSYETGGEDQEPETDFPSVW